MLTSHDFDREESKTINTTSSIAQADHRPMNAELEELAVELAEWVRQTDQQRCRTMRARQVESLSRTQILSRLAARLTPTPCCTRRGYTSTVEPSMLTDDDLREMLIDAEDFVDRIAA